jgi:DNA-binding transcriptional LysR family regulator
MILIARDALDYPYLLHFLVVTKEVSLRRASEVLDVSQASISAQLKQFEEPLEGLFGRVRLGD